MKLTTQNTIYGLLLLLLCFAYGQAAAQNQCQHVQAGETPTGIDAASWASIQKQMQLGKYKAYPDDQGGYASANLAQGFQISYQADGSTTLTPRDADRDFRVATRLVGIGYADIAPLTAPQSLKKEDLPTGSQVTYKWNDHLTEWWTNTEQGLEQWFAIAHAPEGRAAGQPLRVRMALATDMQVSLQANRLALQKGNTTLHYDKLQVWDATGKTLPATIYFYPPVGGEGGWGAYAELQITDAGATYPLTIDPTWTQQAYLKASNTDAGDAFGWSLAISGETLVVGAWREDSNATGVNGDEADNSTSGSGAAYVFVRNGGVWSQQAYLKASNTDANDQFGDAFGASVAISGETIVVGAYREASNATGVNGNQADNSAILAGAAYVFVRSGGVWTQQAYLKASNTGENNFANSVAISGETIVVGAPFEDSNATGVNGNGADNSADDAGAAYVFVRSGGVWTQEAYLKASNTGARDQFGVSVAISGETIVVGAWGEDSNAFGVNGNEADNSAAEAGAVYVFVRNGGVWTQQAYLKASNTGANDEFGTPLAISGETLVVGAAGEDSNAFGVNGNQADNSAASAGAAYVFVRSGGVWTQQAYLKASNAGAGDWFGSVAISGETIVVGAPFESSNATGVNGNQADNSAADAGAAYVFVRSGGVWTQQAYLKASNTGANDAFGGSVAIFGETIVLGAPFEASNATGINGNQADNSADSSGAVYVFTVAVPTAIEDEALATSVQIYPTPTSGILTLELAGGLVLRHAEARVLNTQGATVAVHTYEKMEGTTQLDLTALPAGAYVLQVKAGDKTVQKRFLKLQ